MKPSSDDLNHAHYLGKTFRDEMIPPDAVAFLETWKRLQAEANDRESLNVDDEPSLADGDLVGATLALMVQIAMDGEYGDYIEAVLLAGDRPSSTWDAFVAGFEAALMQRVEESKRSIGRRRWAPPSFTSSTLKG